MIEPARVKTLSEKLGVSESVVFMEAYQMVILDELSELPLAKWLVFKGGTCLKLVHGSYRFSEDLDFSVMKTVSFTEFARAIKRAVAHFPELVLDEVFNRPETLFARIVAVHGPHRVGIKVEISKRLTGGWVKDKDYTVKVVQSPTSSLKPLWKVATIEKIYEDKLKAVESRRKPRDWFDLWFLSQVLGKPWSKKVNVSRKLMEDRVRLLLPKAKRLILKEFEYEGD
jgi:predicted nucleotidyltransferase component of viral defense system